MWGYQVATMTEGISRFGLLVALSLVIATSASAQARGGFGARGMGGSARAPSGASRGLAAPGHSILASRPGVFRPGLNLPPVGTPLNPNFAPIHGGPLGGTPLNPNFAPIREGPGDRFSFPHRGAIGHPFLNRFGRGRGLFPFYPYFAPIFFDTLPLDYDEYDGGDEDPYGYGNEYPPYSSAVPDYYTQGSQQPQFMIPRPGAVAPAENAPSAALPASVPPPELGQLILVRRDGKVLLAVAFAVRNGDLTYVTTEGARRSFPVSELDKEATRQMNDANGTSVSLPD